MTVPRSLASPLAGGSRIVPGSGARFGNMAALGGRIHTGLDLIAKIGTGVTAPAPGVLRWNRFDVVSGRHVELQHNGFTTRYLHLSTVLAGVGMSIPLGATFARSGASGHVTGAHLHFEVLDENGTYVDPEPLLFGGQSSAATPTPAQGIIDKILRTVPGSTQVDPVLVAIPEGWTNPQTGGSCPNQTHPLVYPTVGNPANTHVCGVDNVAGLPGTEGQTPMDLLSAALPVLVNVGVVVVVVVLAFAGVRQALTAAAG